MKDHEKKDVSRRLKIVAGQVNNIESMVNKGVACEEILVQLLAVRGGISQISKLMINSHIHNCITDGIREKDSEVMARELDEFSKILSKFL